MMHNEMNPNHQHKEIKRVMSKMMPMMDKTMGLGGTKMGQKVGRAMAKGLRKIPFINKAFKRAESYK